MDKMTRIRFFAAWLVIVLLLTAALIPTAAQITSPIVPDLDDLPELEPVPGIGFAAEWDGRSRFTMLILGLDRRPGARDNLNSRADTIIIASYDPRNGKLGLLNIPRDMHFGLLDVGELVRVNTLLVRGESRQEGYGPYFMMEILQANLGMYIDAYVAFDFEAFIYAVDSVGGVTIEVPYNISDPTYPDMNYGFDPFFLNAGVHDMNGRTALKYARTRHGDNDYLRGQRQLQVVEAVMQRLRDPDILQNVLFNSPNIVRGLQGHVYTNVPPTLAVRLGLEIMRLNEDDIVLGALNQQYSYDYISAGSVVRVPDRTRLAELLVSTFGEEYWR